MESLKATTPSAPSAPSRGLINPRRSLQPTDNLIYSFLNLNFLSLVTRIHSNFTQCLVFCLCLCFCLTTKLSEQSGLGRVALLIKTFEAIE